MTTAPAPLQPQRTILFAGGGSGGHIAPGLAIAERLVELDKNVRCVFACSNRPVDAHMLSEADQTYFPLNAAPLSKQPAGLFRFVRGTIQTTGQVKTLLRREQIDHVALLGGFVAAPVAWSATRLGIPTTLINLDIPPGKANRWIARRATDIISAIPIPPVDGTAPDGLTPPFDQHIVATPVRLRAMAQHDRATSRQMLSLQPDRQTLLVTGASQGSTSINQLLSIVAQKHPQWFDDWQILHLTGRDDPETMARTYKSADIPALVQPFLDEMGLAWGAADLAISRCGANSVAEVAANAVPTLFLPYPWHTDQHQRRNAQPLADCHAATIADDRIDPQQNLKSIGPMLGDLLRDDSRRMAMRKALQASRPADGASMIAQHLATVLNRR